MESFGHQGQAGRRAHAQGRGALRLRLEPARARRAAISCARTARTPRSCRSTPRQRSRCPGVIAVLTGEDVAAAGHKPMPAAAPMKGRDGAEQKPHAALLARARPRALRRRAGRAGRGRDRGAGAGRGRGGRGRVPRAAGGGDGARRRSPRARRSCTPRRRATWCSTYAGGDEAATNAAFASAAQRGEAHAPTTRAWSAIRWSRAPPWAPTIPPRGPVLPARHHAGRRADARAARRRCSACRPRRCASWPRKWAAASACASTPTRNTARCCSRRRSSAGR